MGIFYLIIGLNYKRGAKANQTHLKPLYGEDIFMEITGIVKVIGATKGIIEKHILDL